MLEFRHITHHYDASSGRIPALEDINLSIEEGEFLCLLGPSGSGKSSLLNMAAGFLAPRGGQVFFRGSPVMGPGRERAVVFQDSQLMPWLTVEQNIRLALPRIDVSEGRRRTAEALEMVGLRGFDTAMPPELSGGMRQKVAIARALVMEAPLLLMDEPFSSLDEQTRLRLNRELVDLWKSQKKTLLFITHSIQEALILGTRVILLSVRPGKIAGQWILRDRKPLLDTPEFAALAGEIRKTMGLCCPPVDDSMKKECCSE